MSPAVLALAAALAGPVQPAGPPVPYPHPLITEVLYAVPRSEGDASGDGNAHSTGDEFVELINPHQKPIQLRGYTLTDRNVGGRGEFRFVFPALELPPGRVVVVFNGNEQRWSEPVGTTEAAPLAASERFGGAVVFTAAVTSSMVAFANAGDWVLLSTPEGRPVQCVWWGNSGRPIPEALRVEEAPTAGAGSVQRLSPALGFVPHEQIDGRPFSPGRFEPAASPPSARPTAPADPGGA